MGKFKRAWILQYLMVGVVLLLATSCKKDEMPAPKVATITTTAVTNVSLTTATSGGNVTSDGGTAISARGVCWSLSNAPTIDDGKTMDGTSTGSFVSSITGLAAGTLYYLRAYATNSAGTSYGSAVSFKTSDAMVTLPTDALPVTKTTNKKVYVHYMPWFENQTSSGNGNWGQHWTMSNQNPNVISVDGKRQIASHFYPMIGPYASSDRDVIDYHLLLMKYAGIDGVIVDWYGEHNVYDYPLTKRNTDSLFSRIPKAGLQFAVCYEDATLTHVQDIAGISHITAAQEDFAYLHSHYFNFSHYITLQDRPLLLCFGPQVMTTASEWQNAFSPFALKPTFISLEYHGDVAGSNGSGEFVWVVSDNLTHLQSFYQNRAPSLQNAFAGAYPGFKDFYAEGGWGSTLFIIDHNGTNTLQSSLDLAKNSGLDYVQLITWNDFGEGTMIEPTLEFDFTFLETIQQYTGVTYSKVELQVIYQWYTLRKKYKGNAVVEGQLTQAYTALVSLDVANATSIINSIP